MEKRVLVFGTFDGIHPGHEFFLRSAKSRGTYLIVGVARDVHVEELKDRRPHIPEQKRLTAIQKLSTVDDAHLCDERLNSFQIVEYTHPDMIVLGHDQTDLEQALLSWMSEHDHYVPMVRVKKL
ncbi:adenylyltransferase/cytidyltransferase family protein [Candidatus Uhrbacteria bacterium]|nr:adenylyltransferase/cytidyltransferase family protein [Candidatus Uhrbacteria bacterium]